MSSNIYIEPTNRNKKLLSDDLKFALRKRFKNGINQVFDETEKIYFIGLSNAVIDDADIVIEMIEKYGEVTINEEY